MSAISTVWNEAKPAVTDLLSEFPSAFSRNMQAFQEGIEQHFYWTASSGASAGQPSLTSGPGSARAYFVPQSQVSATDTGRVFIASDTSHWWIGAPSGCVLQGGPYSVLGLPTRVVSAVAVSSMSTMQSGCRWLVQSGMTTGLTGSGVTITFPTAYAAVRPQITVTPIFSDAISYGVTCSLPQGNSVSTFNVNMGQLGSSSASWGFYWVSEGTVVLS